MKPLLIASIVLSLGATFASAQTPVDPATASTTNPNPATNSNEDEGGNPLGQVGDHSPTGWNKDATVGSGGLPDPKPAEVPPRKEADDTDHTVAPGPSRN